MLERIHIENFKSLKDVTLELQQVNLLIGPNNSGKSNLLKALEFVDNYLNPYKSKLTERNITDFTFKYQKLQLLFEYGTTNQSIIKKAHVYEENHIDILRFDEFYNSLEINKIHDIDNLKIIRECNSYFNFIKIYKPNPLLLTQPQPILYNVDVSSDASNIIAFLETLRDQFRDIFLKIEESLNKCINEYKDIRFMIVESPNPKVDNRTYKKWGLYSNHTNMIHWADELSEGTLYFLALLCIIHQPNPPKLLLLEEPERGIHPRRIKEVIDFIFTLAVEKGIQVIMTSHHERVLDYFEDIPEAVFVFDKDEEGATQVKNLKKDIIDPSNEENDRLGLPRIKFTESLGEHWVTGFIGGVPKPITY